MGIKVGLLVLLVLAALGMTISYATVEVSRDVPGTATINLLPIQESADVSKNRKVDNPDLLAIVAKLGSRATAGDPEDVNHDGVIDVLDLALVARHVGQEVPA